MDGWHGGREVAPGSAPWRTLVTLPLPLPMAASWGGGAEAQPVFEERLGHEKVEVVSLSNCFRSSAAKNKEWGELQRDVVSKGGF